MVAITADPTYARIPLAELKPFQGALKALDGDGRTFEEIEHERRSTDQVNA